MKAALIIIVLTALALTFYYLQGSPQGQLLPLLLTKSLEAVKQDFANQSCTTFSDVELARGHFPALVTGYCKPLAQDFSNRTDFLCAVGLNCHCPNGRSSTPDCLGRGSIKWSSCLDFDDSTTPYCHQTASQTEPQPGQVAADWHCFTPGSKVTVNNQEYVITDKGSAIIGRRLDLWFDSCQDAFNVLGIYEVSLPEKL